LEARRARNHYTHAISKAKRNCWDSFLENAKVQDIWRAKSYVMGREPPRIPSFPHAPTPTDVRDAMMEGFFPLPEPPPARRPILPDPEYKHINLEEVDLALRKSSNKSAPGHDQIPYGVWKAVNRAGPHILPEILDPLLRWGVHPKTLKSSLGIVLPKPGKGDYNQTTSYRIIALIPTLSKILERIVAARLLPLARQAKILHLNQCGSLPGLSTADAVASLRHDIGTAQRQMKKASTLLLDVKGGFDNVHPPTLNTLLKRAKIPTSIRAWVSSFLSNRQVALIFQGGPRDFLAAFMGTPQGSPLSPLLFLIYVSSLHFHPTDGVVFSYVDDFALTIWSPCYEENSLKLASWAESIRAKARSLRLSFSLPKTELIHWRTRQQNGPRCKHPVSFGGTTTLPSRVVRWLGFWLEDNFSTVSHFSRRLALAAASFTKVKDLSHYGKGLNPRACRHLAQAFVRPILMYGANVLTPTKGALHKMETLWRRVARWVTTCFYTTNAHALLAEAALPPVSHMVSLLQTNLAIRIAGSHPSKNPAAYRFPPDFPRPWGRAVPSRPNPFIGLTGVSRPLPWRTIRRYGEARIRLPMDEIAHTLVPLLHTLERIERDRPRFPPYKLQIPEGVEPLPTCPPGTVLDQRDAELHFLWAIETARNAHNYFYSVPTRPHRHMHLLKLPASRIHQMRAGRSYLAAHPNPLDPETDPTCTHCNEGDETFHHAAITCPTRDGDRQALCPNLSSVADDSPLWLSLDSLKEFSHFIVSSRLNFPPAD
jgi:hypothetical protein